jgi:hypothetical protein
MLAIAAAPAAPATALSPADEAALVKAATELRSAIVAKDVSKILQHVSRSGLVCTDTRYSRKEVEADLRAKNGYLQRSLFDTARFTAECGRMYGPQFPWISDRDFFLADQDARLEVKAYSANEAQVVFRSRIPTHYPREYDFRKEGESWRLVSGMILRGCSCG